MHSMSLLALAAATLTVPSLSPRAPGACDLLTVAQVSGAAGAPMQQAPGPVSSIGCSWGGVGNGPKRNVSISIRPASEYAVTQSRLSSMLVPVSNLGDGAFFFPTKHNNVMLYLLKGAHEYALTVSVTGNTLAQNEAAEKALAGEMLTNL